MKINSSVGITEKLRTLAAEIEELINTNTVQSEGGFHKQQGLSPRRAEIVEIITDHKVVSFDFLKRRFRVVPERTLHYDLAQLIKSGHVIKLGATRGVLYKLTS